jgi:hypothetical protein
MKQEYEQEYPNQYVPYESCTCFICKCHRNHSPKEIIDLQKRQIEFYSSPPYDPNIVFSMPGMSEDPLVRVKSFKIMKRIYELEHATYNKLYPPIYHIDFDEYMNSTIECACSIHYFDDYDAVAINGIPLFKLLADSKIVGSNSEARRLIKQGGIQVNYQVIKNENEKINESYIKKDHSTILITIGKYKHHIIKLRSFKNKDPEITNWDLHHYNPETKEFSFEENGLLAKEPAVLTTIWIL